MVVSGCSGCGKGAYVTGIFSRVPVIVESRGGGAANLRQAEWFKHGDGHDIYQCIDQGARKYPQSRADPSSRVLFGPGARFVRSFVRELRSEARRLIPAPAPWTRLLEVSLPKHVFLERPFGQIGKRPLGHVDDFDVLDVA